MLVQLDYYFTDGEEMEYWKSVACYDNMRDVYTRRLDLGYTKVSPDAYYKEERHANKTCRKMCTVKEITVAEYENSIPDFNIVTVYDLKTGKSRKER